MLASQYSNGTRVEEESKTAAHLGVHLAVHLGVGMVLRLASATATDAVAAWKDDAPAAGQAAITNIAAVTPFSGAGGLIQTTSG